MTHGRHTARDKIYESCVVLSRLVSGRKSWASNVYSPVCCLSSLSHHTPHRPPLTFPFFLLYCPALVLSDDPYPSRPRRSPVGGPLPLRLVCTSSLPVRSRSPVNGPGVQSSQGPYNPLFTSHHSPLPVPWEPRYLWVSS